MVPGQVWLSLLSEHSEWICDAGSTAPTAIFDMPLKRTREPAACGLLIGSRWGKPSKLKSTGHGTAPTAIFDMPLDMTGIPFTIASPGSRLGIGLLVEAIVDWEWYIQEKQAVEKSRLVEEEMLSRQESRRFWWIWLELAAYIPQVQVFCITDTSELPSQED